jgi:2-oxoisovalerate dehydrogenase E1 component alpha subunit
MTDLLTPTTPGETDQHAPLQFLSHTGERVYTHDNEQFRQHLAHLTLEDLRAFYRDMSVVRRFDTEATALQRQGELALYAPLLGQEAAQIGSAHALRTTDMVFPSYREHGVAHVRGLDVAKILRLFRGIDHGGWDSFENNFHLYTLVIGSHALHATGYAMGLQRDAKAGRAQGDEAVLVYFGDGATSQGDVSEALGFAAVNNAPVVFFVQNNQWAISVPNEKQFKGSLHTRGLGFGVPGIQIDGNDPLASYAATRWALEHARTGQGPVLIEALTYRMGAHTTSDDPTKYRTREEENYWRDRDPIARVKALLTNENAWTESDEAALAAELEGFGEYLRGYVKGMERPLPSSMFDHVYATENALVSQDKAWFAQYEASFIDNVAQSNNSAGATK